jgi:hypothetical protein
MNTLYEGVSLYMLGIDGEPGERWANPPMDIDRYVYVYNNVTFTTENVVLTGYRFWEMLAYLANTLIFILVGIVITEKAIPHSELQDWFLLAALYCMVFVIRLVTIHSASID